jgi:hypothetical protein
MKATDDLRPVPSGYIFTIGECPKCHSGAVAQGKGHPEVDADEFFCRACGHTWAEFADSEPDTPHRLSNN